MLNTSKRKITSWEHRNKVYELWCKGEFFPSYYVKIQSERKSMIYVDYEDYGSRYNVLKAYPNLREFI
jgi:hypothetical protein